MEWFGGLMWYWQAAIVVVTVAVIIIVAFVWIIYKMQRQADSE